jgi:pilus assembly protein CpaC
MKLLLDVAERTGWTFAQALAGALVAAPVGITLGTFDWRTGLTAATTAAVIALLKTLAVASSAAAAAPAPQPAQPAEPAPQPAEPAGRPGTVGELVQRTMPAAPPGEQTLALPPVTPSAQPGSDTRALSPTRLDPASTQQLPVVGTDPASVSAASARPGTPDPARAGSPQSAWFAPTP